MKKITLIVLALFTYLSYAQRQDVVYEIDPCTFGIGDEITITIFGSSLDEAAWGIDNGVDNGLYLWTWYNTVSDTGNNNDIGAGSNGTFGNSNEINRFTYNPGSDTYTYSFTPVAFFGTGDIGNIGFLVKPKDGTTGNQSEDYEVGIGESAFAVNLSSPTETTLIVSPGGNVTISASNTCGLANYDLKINGTSVSTSNNVESFTYTDTGITTNRAYSLEVTQGTEERTLSVTAVLNPNTVSESIPSGLVEGINYDSNDDTKATLVLNAPGKDYIFVAGTFNNYQPTGAFAMKKDSGSDLFFLELTNLTPGQIYNYQYWVVDETPIADSPSLVKTADPYSTLVLSNFDDPFIPASSYPNLPEYPEGQFGEVTVLQTAKPEYNWQVNNFVKPKKEDLVIYEVLVRDFDANRNYQDLIDRIDYFKALNINAIHLMPVMEFEGNESWGYNTSFHMALDKFYGSEDKLKEFIDLCHQNGIAIILDVVLNHAFGRHPWVRMWMTDPDGNGFGDPSVENPYFNQTPQHDYNVGYDFSHTEELPNDPNASSNDSTNPIVNAYTRRVIKHWIEEFRIDGFRWDLTKGFTQNCGPGSFGGCTDAPQPDRVQILQDYADYSWSLDPDHYVIFEHLGQDSEEQQWANYREAEGKGIMMWGKMTNEYNELTMGQNGNKNISRMGHLSRGFNKPRLLGYPESHDEERLMYKNLQFGNSFGGYDITNLDTALGRMSALAAVSVTIPGPKMIWHFGDLGMENSIFTCNNGSVNTENDAIPGDCKLDTKPQPQWPWYDAVNPTGTDAIRQQIFNDCARLHELKITEAVFEGDYTISNSSGNDFLPRIDIFDTSIPDTELKNVVILSNFDVVDQTVNTNFPIGGIIWYDLMDPTGVATLPFRTMSVTIPAGGFRIFGNAPSIALSTEDFELDELKLYPNPTRTSFKINSNTSNVEVYDITGKLVKSFSGEFNSSNEFDIVDLKTGVYIVKVENNNNQSMTTKLVKL